MTYFVNNLYQNLGQNDQNILNTQTTPSIQRFKSVYFELSNICNYSFIHKNCPLSKIDSKEILPLHIIVKVIDELIEKGFTGQFSFHRYNEPLIDPRLFWIINYIKEKNKNANIRLLTNGFYLNQTMVSELVSFGLNYLEVSAYSKKEYDFLTKLNVPISYKVTLSILDNRIEIYTRKVLNISKPCNTLINEININCKAQLVLCCLDYENKNVFGDLKFDTVEEIINTEKYQNIHYELSKGNRNCDICKRCDWQR